jgi:hypothetical protein
VSYDLLFYRLKKNAITEADIRKYLQTRIAAAPGGSDQWTYENEDTGVYCSFEYDNPADQEAYEGFEPTGFLFNINYMRPRFFGLETFPLVEALVNELDLYILNPQIDTEMPARPAKGSVFENWNKSNLRISAENFEPLDCTYISPEISDRAWRYNFNKRRLQEQLGNNYFVPRLSFMRINEDLEAVTVAVWTEHIPIVIPPADYFVLADQHINLFQANWKRRLITRETFMTHFSSYLEDFDFEGCHIIHPDNAAKAKTAYYAVHADDDFESFLEPVSVETLYNAR